MRSSSDEGAASDESMPATDARTCSCGHTVEHHMVSPVRSYSLWGWTRFIMGITAVPTRIRFTCRRCHEVIAQTSDPRVMHDRTYS